MTSCFVNKLKEHYPLLFGRMSSDQMALKRLENALTAEDLPFEWLPSVLREHKFPQPLVEIAWGEHVLGLAKRSGQFQRISLSEELPEFKVSPGEYVVLPAGEWQRLCSDEVLILDALDEEIVWTKVLLIHELSQNTEKDSNFWGQVLDGLIIKLDLKIDQGDI